MSLFLSDLSDFAELELPSPFDVVVEVLVVSVVAEELVEVAGLGALFALPPVVAEVDVEAAGEEADAAVAEVAGVDVLLAAAVGVAVPIGVVVAAAVPVAVAVARGEAVAEGDALIAGDAVAVAVAEGDAVAIGLAVAVAVAAGVIDAAGVAVAFCWALMPVCVVTPLRPPPLPRLMLIPAAGCTP